jgi:exonuclease III
MASTHHESQNSNFKIATLNIGGINNNAGYLNSLVMSHNIVCIQETWATTAKTISDAIYCSKKRVVHYPASRRHKTGRASGGIAFILDTDLKYESRFISPRLRLLKVSNLTIINVYLPFHTGELDTQHEYDQEIENLQALLESEKRENVIIIGDMNTDITKPNHNTTSLLNFILKNGLTLADIKQQQSTEYTYRKIVNDKLITSWIDHVICSLGKIENIKTKILASDNNFVDHNAITLTITNVQDAIIRHKTEPKKPKLNWLNHQQQERYQYFVEKEIRELGNLTDNLKRLSDKNTLRPRLNRQ